MKLTKGFEQGVCIMALLSTQDSNIPLSAEIINKRLKGSPTYIKKIIRKLVVADLVVSVSGTHGGFSLKHDPKDISLLDIVNALEGEIDTYPSSGLFTGVFADSIYVLKGRSAIHKVFKNADALWQDYLKNISVLDVIQDAIDIKEISKHNWNVLLK